jgi:hypothetical protein
MVYCAATGSQYQVYMKLCLTGALRISPGHWGESGRRHGHLVGRASRGAAQGALKKNSKKRHTYLPGTYLLLRFFEAPGLIF